MPPHETIILDKNQETHIARITMNRPERLNANNPQMVAEMGEALEDVAKDDGMRVLILTGAGRGFSAGGDQSGSRHTTPRTPEEIRRGFEGAQKIVLGLHKMEKPTIAMVNGVAAGGGFDLACACDIRIGCAASRFVCAYVRIGLFPGWGGTWLYPRALGSISKAAELLFTGDFIEADEAYRYGLLDKLVPTDELETATMEMARKIAAGPPIAIRLSKLLLYKGLEWDLETAMKMAAAAETITITSEDRKEGVAAYREKRKPQYKGR